MLRMCFMREKHKELHNEENKLICLENIELKKCKSIKLVHFPGTLPALTV
jgi:hypothetical protein